ncbi:MAG: hypothetical protein K2X08_01630 [Chlamydiales bacterium]|nr:hypothetical protein [Chlamydiales bacterium]
MSLAIPKLGSQLLQVSVDPIIFSNFPETKVALLVLKIKLDEPKGATREFLTKYKLKIVTDLTQKGITSENYKAEKVCKSWQEVFQTFNVEADKTSTIENLFKRAALEADKIQSGKSKRPDLWRFNNFVDFYNCVSVDTSTPMGALAFGKIDGPITLRYGKEGETFTPLGKVEEKIDVKPEHIVYADNSSVLTWLWNYRDGQHCCVPKKSAEETTILLFADQAHEGGGDAQQAISTAKEKLPEIGGKCLLTATLDAKNPSIEVDLEKFS